MTLLGDLHACLQEHRRCGDIDAAVEGDRVWMMCTFGAVIRRPVEDESIERRERDGAW